MNATFQFALTKAGIFLVNNFRFLSPTHLVPLLLSHFWALIWKKVPPCRYWDHSVRWKENYLGAVALDYGLRPRCSRRSPCIVSRRHLNITNSTARATFKDGRTIPVLYLKPKQRIWAAIWMLFMRMCNGIPPKPLQPHSVSNPEVEKEKSNKRKLLLITEDCMLVCQ